jgi:hypothetical protein
MIAKVLVKKRRCLPFIKEIFHKVPHHLNEAINAWKEAMDGHHLHFNFSAIIFASPIVLLFVLFLSETI